MTEEVANGAAPVAEAASTPTTETAAPSFRTTMEAVYDKAYPPREDTGRFAGKTETQAEAAPPDEAAPAPETTDQPETPTAETAPAPSIEPPASWSADAKAKWAAVPPDVQQIIAAREAEAHKAITQTGERLKAYEALDAVIGPRREALRAAWGNEGAGIAQLFQLSDFATRDPAGFVQWFVQQNRVDLSRLTTAQAAPATPADPHVAALHQEVSAIKSTLTQQQQAALDADIRQFADEKAPNGEKLRPHFDDVRTEMGRLISAGIAQTLEDAYAKAIRTNDAVWAKVQAAEEAKRVAAAEAEQKRQREAAAKVAAEARKAASVNIRSQGAVSGAPAKGQTMRETMAATYDRVHAA